MNTKLQSRNPILRFTTLLTRGCDAEDRKSDEGLAVRCVTLACVLGLLAASPAQALDPKAPESCATGPVEKTYGGTEWLVVSCSDGKSLVFVAKEGSKAAPFEFDLTFTGEGYDLAGHGKGDRNYTDAAYADLQKIKAADVLALIKATQAAKPQKLH